jgi:hypothetical protein
LYTAQAALPADAHVEAARLQWLKDKEQDAYGGCANVRIGSDALPSIPSGEWVWPRLCGNVSGWAGIGTYRRGFAFAFSTDSKHFLVCGWHGCAVDDLRTGHVVEWRSVDWKGDTGGDPVEETADGKSLFLRWRASTREGVFPYVADVAISWWLDPGGAALYLTFVERTTGQERPVLRFPPRQTGSQEPVVPERLWLTPDGAALALRVMTGQGGTGIDAGIVNVHAEAAALFRAVGESSSDEGLRRAFWAKAKVAESRSNGVAQVLPAASTL